MVGISNLIDLSVLRRRLNLILKCSIWAQNMSDTPYKYHFTTYITYNVRNVHKRSQWHHFKNYDLSKYLLVITKTLSRNFMNAKCEEGNLTTGKQNFHKW